MNVGSVTSDLVLKLLRVVTVMLSLETDGNCRFHTLF
jgi:hypothetical protein